MGGTLLGKSYQLVRDRDRKGMPLELSFRRVKPIQINGTKVPLIKTWIEKMERGGG